MLQDFDRRRTAQTTRSQHLVQFRREVLPEAKGVTHPSRALAKQLANRLLGVPQILQPLAEIQNVPLRKRNVLVVLRKS